MGISNITCAFFWTNFIFYYWKKNENKKSVVAY